MAGMTVLKHVMIACAAMWVSLGAGSCARSGEDGGEGPLIVFAAASTTDVMEIAAARFEARAGVEVIVNVGASSTLARQIEAGARADVYVSANALWMDRLEEAGLVREGSRRDLLGNRMALIAMQGRGFEIEMTGGASLAEAMGDGGRVAVGDPAHVPAGRYAKQALEAMGWWAEIEGRVITAQDVRAALRLVELGEAEAGVVYATDARRSARVEVVGVFPETAHEAIRYPAALTGDHAEAGSFLAFLFSTEMEAVFEEAGFDVVGAEVMDGESAR
jgi:molybdate transport system substrate-binding protein